jgi:hydroxyacyl-ACP dehydratase HTD2-like protein with hotdog domain
VIAFTVEVGDVLPPLSRTPTRVTLFLFGVAYWTSHRLHYDVESARAEGFDDVVVTANLLSAYNVELLSRWTGEPQCILELEERNVSPAVAGEPLTITGRVIALGDRHGYRTARCALSIAKDDGTAVVEGTALVLLPQARVSPAVR